MGGMVGDETAYGPAIVGGSMVVYDKNGKKIEALKESAVKHQLAAKTDNKAPIKLAQTPHEEDGHRVVADTGPSLCVNKGTCEKEGTEVSYGPYKATNGYLRGHG